MNWPLYRDSKDNILNQETDCIVYGNYIHRKMELLYWLKKQQNKLVEWKAFVDTKVRIKTADLKKKNFVLVFCSFPCFLDVGERLQTAIYCFEWLGRLSDVFTESVA